MKNILVVGTSPVGLINAILLAKNNQKVSVIDTARVPGGAWSDIEKFLVQN